MKKALVLVLCFALLLTLAVGCTPQTTTTAPTTPTSSGATTPEATTTLGPPAEIVYVYPLFTEQADQAVIEAAVNEISLAKINVKATLAGLAIANYQSQVPLKITGGEAMDLVCTLPGGPTLYSTMVAQGQFKDITELAPMYAQAAIDAFNDVNPNYIAGAYIGGKLYGLPNLFDKVSSTYLDFKKSAIDEAGIDLTKMKNITDFEAICKTLSEKNDIPVLGSSGNAWGHVLASSARFTNYDDFATLIVAEFFSSAEWAYGAIIGDDNTKVVNAYESDNFKQQIAIARDWFLKGYISKDAATQMDSGYAIVKANGALGQITDGEIGHQTFVSNQTGFDMTSVVIAPAIVNTGIMQKFVTGLPVTCKNDEAALRFLSLLYTDADIINLLNFGIEGEYYVANADGTISLPEGTNPTSARYWVNSPFMFGSQFLAKVVKPDPADLRQQALALNKNATTSPMLGFAVDPAAFTNEYTAVINVITQYAPGLTAGSSDPAVVMPKFLAALNDAGMQTIIAKVQEQVDAFVASK